MGTVKFDVAQRDPAGEEVAQEAGPAAKAAINSLLLASLSSLSETTEDQKFAEALTAELATSLARTGLLDLKLVAAGPVVAGEELSLTMP